MGKAKKILVGFVLLLLPMGLFQNCADYMTPQHDGGGFDLSSYNPAGYSNTLKPLLQTNCAACHGANQDPKFAVANDALAIELLVAGDALVNSTQPASSEIVTKIAGGHSGLPTTLSAQLQTAIAAWAAGMVDAP